MVVEWAEAALILVHRIQVDRFHNMGAWMRNDAIKAPGGEGRIRHFDAPYFLYLALGNANDAAKLASARQNDNANC